ncbi:MAG: thioredoxin [Prolixibacteraceae bacterium]|jgi:thioredoxin 1|nr:thioredoxin [Prolixibacteraceae bacterium]MDI9563661.1 thioredoxin [Bacteroidota bacterium]NLT00641.1 thioredoxin [Bacteroidales bacterium]OQB79995.1 MAG: Thioredoxin-1 [Bacteroidetes bacterium ADurb.Bin123]HNZ68275.1 thioredoxin [Prolixibacteraceae bacterium]
MRGRFENIINTDKPVLVDFYAEWCAPCKVVPPLLKQVKERFNDNIRIIKVNVDSNPSIAGRYDIRSIPTLMLFRNGRTLWKAAGVRAVEEITRVVEQAIS